MIKIAYLILAHSDPENLKRLVDRLDDHKASFFVHIDQKTDVEKFKNYLVGYKDVHFIEQRYNIYWGGFSIIRAEIALVRASIGSSKQFDRYVLLSGADYPIKSADYIYDYFEKNKEIEFIRGINLEKLENKELFGSHIDYWQKHDYPFIRKTNTIFFTAFRASINRVLRNFKLSSKIRHDKFDLYHGSQWWALSDDCLRELIETYDQNKEDYKVFEIMFAPDEKFFHTLFFNSNYSNRNQASGPDQPIQMDKRGEDTSRQTSLLANIHFLDASMTKWFTKEDYDLLKNSEKLFVRKVSTDRSEALLEKIDKEILNKRTV
ncbi:beta-1,6-N-acetylglucosaminyltransferase [Marinilactibacillus sp. XAAS-LB27]|uniref:beta-1,6-N-acetylglucosaminyltransferase n=1 Tax=Marinilactibacillus sp. XAAS-LB27 TaxID=3114538 RepID=UPI002E19570F|nr:beta-1,6-N-acetylglucosaminyltransferase [Marinilactibacillus sp. XAAS-LB27]